MTAKSEALLALGSLALRLDDLEAALDKACEAASSAGSAFNELSDLVNDIEEAED